ncbi:unnamed protein product, partial [marine sediment metagenome]
GVVDPKEAGRRVARAVEEAWTEEGRAKKRDLKRRRARGASSRR